MKIRDHRLLQARFVESPNADERPEQEISLIVVHGISLPAGHFGTPYVEQLFCNQLDSSVHPDFCDLAGLAVSSHLLIRRDGEVVQFVLFNRRAWHAGESSFEGRSRCNDFAVGIELEGTDDSRYRDVQYKMLANVCDVLQSHYDIPPAHLVGHSDIAPGRKTDPGKAFDWSRLRATR